MNVSRIIEHLENKYPGKSIFKNNENAPTEIICEIEPATEHPSYSRAVAVIDKSTPHFHKETTETYKVTKGKLILFVNGERHVLKVGEELVIRPNLLHWAEGNEVWVECYSEPGWTSKDHIVVDVKKIAQDIVERSIPILEKYELNEFSPILDYVDVFPKSEEEHRKLSTVIKTTGEPVFNTSTGTAYKLFEPIDTAKGKLNLLRVRIYDPTRLGFRGHSDYAIDNYERAKERLLKMETVKLLDRKSYEMIEIWDKQFEVLVYIPNVPLSKDVRS